MDRLLSEPDALLHVIRDVALYKPRASPPESSHLQSHADIGIDFLGKALGTVLEAPTVPVKPIGWYHMEGWCHMEKRCTLNQGRIFSGSGLARIQLTQAWDWSGIWGVSFIFWPTSLFFRARAECQEMKDIDPSAYNHPCPPVVGRFTSICVLLVLGVCFPCIGSEHSCLQVTYLCGYRTPPE